MAFDLKKWLDNLAAKGQMSAEDRTVLEEKLGKAEVVRVLEEEHLDGLRQKDYDRLMNANKKEHEEAMRGVTGLQTELTNWRTEAQKKLDQAVADLRARDSTIAQYEARVRQIATDYGLDVNTLLPVAAPAQPNSPAAPAPSASPKSEDDRFQRVTEDLDKAKKIFPLIPAEIHDLSVEHQELFGKPLSNSTELVANALKEGRTVRDLWAEQYKVEDRRKEIARQQQEQHDAEIRADERRKILSEQSVPTFRPDAPRSPIFTAIPQKHAPEAKPGELNSIDKAVMSYEQGKYRQPQQGT